MVLYTLVTRLNLPGQIFLLTQSMFCFSSFLQGLEENPLYIDINAH